MFGEEYLFGQDILNIDDKNRIFIPSYTKRETGEKLVLMYDTDLELYHLYNSLKIEEIFEELNKKLLGAKTKQEEIMYKRKIYEMSKSILKSSKIDSHGRLLIGKIFEEEKVLSIGAHDHLILKPIKNKK